MNKLITTIAIVSVLSGCENGSIIVDKGPFIGTTAANKALKGSAYSISLVNDSELKPGHIYKVAQNQFFEICDNDIKHQKELKKITFKTEENPNLTVEDDLVNQSLHIGVPGLSLSPSYSRITVSGYKTIEAEEPNGNQISDYILKNVKRGKDSCKDKVLPANRPYFIVEKTAVGNTVDVYRKIGIELNTGIGGFKGTEEHVNTKSKVVFCAVGKLVPAKK